MKEDTVSKGVELLLQRMDSNPLEFVFGDIENYGDSISDSKWYHFLPTRPMSQLVEDGEELSLAIPEFYLTEYEKKLLQEKLHSLYRQEYEQAVMRKLLGAPKPKVRKR